MVYSGKEKKMAVNVDHWEYARWVYIVGRSLRFNEPSGAEYTAAQTFVNNMLVKRPWLETAIKGNSEADGLLNNKQYWAKAVTIIGNDMQKISLQDTTEKTYCDTLFAATGDRRYGEKGGPAGADVVR